MTLTDAGSGRSVLLVYSLFTMKFCYHDLEKVAFTVCLIIWYRYPVYWISHNLNIVEPVASQRSHKSVLPSLAGPVLAASALSLAHTGFEALELQ